jgi:hypothetical protein
MAEKNVSIAGAAKATGLGGAVFLIPGVPAFFVLGKVFNMLRSLARRSARSSASWTCSAPSFWMRRQLR